VALVVVAALSACSDDDDARGDEQAMPLVGKIAPAIAAVEAELGGPQQFFEVNATPQVVNLFVATADGTGVTPFVYVGDELAPAGDPSSALGNTFGADAVTFDPDAVLDQLTADLPESDVVLFTVVGGPGGAVQYSAGVQSQEGGALDVVLGGDGAVESVSPVTVAP
jgi:hypothetical protein